MLLSKRHVSSLACLLLLFPISCTRQQDEQVVPESKVEIQVATESQSSWQTQRHLMKFVMQSELDHVSSQLRSKGLTFADKDSVVKFGQSYYSHNSDALQWFDYNYSQNFDGPKQSVPAFMVSFNTQLTAVIEAAQEQQEVLDFLAQQIPQIMASPSFDPTQKKAFLRYISQLEVLTAFTVNNMDVLNPAVVYNPTERRRFWKCLVAIVAGAIGGASSAVGLVGEFLPACNILLPGGGMVACGGVAAVAGAVIGAIAVASESGSCKKEE